MASAYSNYKPWVLSECNLDVLKQPEYEEFIRASAIEPGVRLVLERHRRRPDWPFIDTKFNPNTGQDLPPDSYNFVYGWLLGRGAEALAAHLDWLETATGLSYDETVQARQVFSQLLAGAAEAIVKMADANGGVCPFRVRRQDYKAVDATGQLCPVNPARRSAGNIFCGKGLAATGLPEYATRGGKMLLEVAEALRNNTYDSDQAEDRPQWIGQGGKMLWLAAPLLVRRKVPDGRLWRAVLQAATEFVEFILDRHWDPGTGLFAENLEAATGRRLGYLDPGHANEFVGLGLGAVEALELKPGWLTETRRTLIERARRQMPGVLLRSCELGWNRAHGGLHKAVDTASGRVLDDDLPWWSLPETMRAAARACEFTFSKAIREQLLEWFRLCHNAYFEHYLNRDNMLFPFQNRSGSTGQVLDKPPAVPEADPLFHANLSFLDMLAVIRRLR